MFEIDVPTTMTVRAVNVLNQKNAKDDADPGAKLTFEGSVSNDVLSTLEGHLKGALYSKANGKPVGQAELEGVPPVSDMPMLTQLGRQCGTIVWSAKMTGYQLVVHLGIDSDESNIDETSCEIVGMRIKPEEGGAVKLKFDVKAPNLSAKQWTKLPRLKGREVEIALFAPSLDAQREIDDSAGPKH